MKRLGLLHFAGNAALIALIYGWLGIGDAAAWQLFATVVLGLLILIAGLWLHAGSFVWFREQQPSALAPVFRSALSRLPAFAAVGVLALLAYWLLFWLDARAYPPAASLASWLTFHLRRPAPPVRMYEAFHAILWTVRWLVLPAFLLPLASAASVHSWMGFRGVGWPAWPRFYWLKCIGLTLAAFYLPAKLIHWVPAFPGIGMQTASLTVRFLAAYLLFLAGWLALLFLSSGGRPRVTQPSTTALP